MKRELKEEEEKLLKSQSTPGENLNQKDITPIIEAAARVGATERQTIAIVNAAKEADGVDLKANPSEVLVKTTFHRKKTKHLSQKSEEAVASTNCVFFDGKKSKTLTAEKVDEEYTRQTEMVQDHYVVTDATRESYVGEFTPQSGSGPGVGQGLVDFVDGQEGLSGDDLEAIGGDSTAVNTGNKGGAFAHIEKKLKRPLNWFVCLLHILELFLGHFVRIYVGVTSGPDSWKSELGKKIKNLKDPKITTFPSISCPNFPTIPEDVLKVNKYKN